MNTIKNIQMIAFVGILTLGSQALGQTCWQFGGNSVSSPSTNYFGSSNNESVYINTNATNRMVIHSGGNIGIGTASPSETVHVDGSARFGDGSNYGQFDSDGDLTLKGNADYLVNPNSYAFNYKPDPDYGLFLNTDADRYELRNATADPIFWVRIDAVKEGDTYIKGKLGVNTPTPSHRLTVMGHAVPALDCDSQAYDIGKSALRWDEVYACNGTIQTSDIRLKEDISDMPYGLEEVLQLRPITYRWKNKPLDGRKIGLVAQELKQVIPEVVKTGEFVVDENGNKKWEEFKTMGVYYADLIPVLIKAIQEQQHEIETGERATLNLEHGLRELETLLKERGISIPQGLSIEVSEAKLFHNYPNPFSMNTVIQAYVPEQAQTVAIVVYDVNQTELLRIPIKKRGTVQVMMELGDLDEGVYVYSLEADGKTVSSKKLFKY